MDTVIARVHPVDQGAHATIGKELSDTAHRASDPTVAKHDSVGLGPMGLSKGNRLGVKISVFEGLEVVLQGVVVVREGFHETAEFV